MRDARTQISLLFCALVGCSETTDISGVWHTKPCQESPCSSQLRLDIGQYGQSVSGLVTWYQGQEGINTYEFPSFQCACHYIQAGTLQGTQLRLISKPNPENCEDGVECSPCNCQEYALTFVLTEDEKLVGQITCAGNPERQDLELYRASAPLSKVCLGGVDE